MSKPVTPLPVPDAAASQIKLLLFDFDGVFTDNAVWISEDGKEAVRCFRADGFGIEKMKKLGVNMAVISTEPNSVVKKRCEKLGIPAFTGIDDKQKVFEKLIAEQRLNSQEVAYMGNDINDVNCLRIVGVSVVVADAYPEAVAVARYQTSRRGGEGAVREVCDWITACKNHLASL